LLELNLSVRKQFLHLRRVTFPSIARKIDVQLFLLVIFIFSYAIFFSYVTISRMFTLQTYAYDLGIYNQAIHSTSTGQGFLYYTADLLANPSGSVFGVHISFILLIITPIYSLFPGPQTLLVIQSLVLALGALPIYFLAKQKLKSKNLAFVFSSVFLLSPSLMGINWYDFHPEAFIILPMLLTFYFAETKNWYPYIISVIFVLLAMDQAAVLIIIFGLYKLATLKKAFYLEKPLLQSKLIVYVFTVILGIVWFLLCIKLVTDFNPNNLYVSGSSEYWSILGAKNILGIPGNVIFHPVAAINALTFDWAAKLGYITILLGPTLFLLLFAPKTTILVVPWLAISLLSNYGPYYQVGNQYPAFIFPAIIYGSIIGLSNIVYSIKKPHFFSRINKKCFFTIFSVSLLLSTLAFQITSGPFSELSLGRFNSITYGFPEASPKSLFVENAIKLIPENASVLTQNNIFPLLSNNYNAYVTPFSVFYPPRTSFGTTLTGILEKVDYVIVDSESFDGAIILSHPIVKENFGLIASGEHIILVKRGYIGKPEIFTPLNETFNYQRLVLLQNTTSTNDSDSINKMVLLHSGSSSGDFWYGPYEFLPPGEYQSTFRIKIDNPVSNGVLELRINSWPSTLWITPLGDNVTGYHLAISQNWTHSEKTLASMKIYGGNFTTGKYQEFILDFSVATFGVYEFIGVDVKTQVSIYFDQIQVTQISPNFVYKTDIR
jgi:uncharacterized membrane protein